MMTMFGGQVDWPVRVFECAMFLPTAIFFVATFWLWGSVSNFKHVMEEHSQVNQPASSGDGRVHSFFDVALFPWEDDLLGMTGEQRKEWDESSDWI